MCHAMPLLTRFMATSQHCFKGKINMLSVSLIQGTNFSVTIRVRPLLQYFYVVQLVSQHFTKRNLEFLMLTVASSGNE